MSRRIGFILLSPALLYALFLGNPILGGQATAAEVVIETNRITLDKDTGITIYEDGLLRVGDLSFFAARVEMNPARNMFEAEGFIYFKSPTISGSASSFRYDAEEGIAVLNDANLYDSQRGLYLRGEKVTIFPDGEIVLEKCSFTTCSFDLTAKWRISASKVTLGADDLGVAWNPTISIGSVPVFWLPVIVWPTVRERRSGLLPPEISDNSSSLPRLDLGIRLKVPIFINLGLEHDLTVEPETIEKRATGSTFTYNYAFSTGQSGQISAFGIKEDNPRDPAEENNFLPSGEAQLRDSEPARYTLDWRHSERFGESIRLSLGYHHSSDGQVRREYQRATEFRPYRTYQVSLTHQGAWSGTGVTFEQNADYLHESIYANRQEYTDLQQRPKLLPRIFLNSGGQPVDAVPIGLEMNVSFVRFEAPEDISGRLIGVSPTLSWPISLGRAFEIQPTITRHYYSYDHLNQFISEGNEVDLDSEKFSQGESSLEVRGTFAKLFFPDESRFGITKHRFVPRLIFTELEDVEQPFPNRVLPPRIAQQLITFRLDNQWLGLNKKGNWDSISSTGRPGGFATEFFHLNLIQRYNLLQRKDAEPLIGPILEGDQETEKGEPMLPLILETALAGSGFRIFSTIHYHHQRRKSNRASAGFNLTFSKHSRLNLSYTFNKFAYLKPNNELVGKANRLSFLGKAGITDKISMGLSGRYNYQTDPPPLNHRRLTRIESFMEYNPGCYLARLSYRENIESSVENDKRIYYIDKRLWLTFNLNSLLGGNSPSVTANEGGTTSASSANNLAGMGLFGNKIKADQCRI